MNFGKTAWWLAGGVLLVGIIVRMISGEADSVPARQPAKEQVDTPLADGDTGLPSSVPVYDAPSGAIADEAVLFFENAAALADFLKRAKKARWTILGKIDALNAVRVRVTDTMPDFSQFRGWLGSGFNYSLRVPEILPEAQARENVGGGRVPVGSGALAQLGVTPASRSYSQEGEGVKIAVLDSGIYAEHAVLRGAKISQIDMAGGIADTPESLTHGTAVASLIVGNGADGISGMAPNAELLAVRVFDGAGNATAFTLAQGIVAAVDAGARVLNISAGVSADSSVLRAAVEYAQAAGATLVAAAGNEGVTALAFPAAYPGVVAVGAVDGRGTSAPFSNVGENLSVVAPGVGVYAAGTQSGDACIEFSGTSAAAPLVAGVIAALGQDATGGFNADVLSAAADDLGTPGYDFVYGAGLVNFERLVRPIGVAVSDVSVNDFYILEASGGKTGKTIGMTLQNRGTLWENCTFSLKLVFANGAISTTSGNLNLKPGESTGQGMTVPAEALKEGVGVIAEIRKADGTMASEASVFLKTAEQE